MGHVTPDFDEIDSMPRTDQKPEPPAATATLLQRVQAARARLRPSERRVADHVLQHPNDAIDLSFSELARRAGVSQPTVARFCTALGFTGLREFKLRLAKSLATALPYTHHGIDENDAMADVGAKVIDRAIAALITVRNHLDPLSLTRSVEALSAAQRVDFCGIGHSGPVALDARDRFFRLGVVTHAPLDRDRPAPLASMLKPGDVLVAISGSGQTREVIRSVEMARETGAIAIGVTVPASPLALACDISLDVDVSEDLDVHAPMPSRLAHLAVLDVLAVAVALARDRERQRRPQGSNAVREAIELPDP